MKLAVSNAIFQLRKLRKTLKGLYRLGMARTFGKYIHTIGGPNMPHTAIYEYKGKRWHIALNHETYNGMGD